MKLKRHSNLDIFLWLIVKCYSEVSTKRYGQIQRKCQTNKITKKIHLWGKKGKHGTEGIKLKSHLL